MLTGSASADEFVAHAATMSGFDTDALTLPDAEVFQAMFEMRIGGRETSLPRGLHPTGAPTFIVQFWHCPESPWGPFSLAQGRVGSRSGLRPRGHVQGCVCDNDEASAALRARWGFPGASGDGHAAPSLRRGGSARRRRRPRRALDTRQGSGAARQRRHRVLVDGRARAHPAWLAVGADRVRRRGHARRTPAARSSTSSTPPASACTPPSSRTTRCRRRSRSAPSSCTACASSAAPTSSPSPAPSPSTVAPHYRASVDRGVYTTPHRHMLGGESVSLRGGGRGARRRARRRAGCPRRGTTGAPRSRRRPRSPGR